MQLGRLIAGFRLKHGHTQESLAIASGISRGYLSRIEVGEHHCTVQVLEKLVAACDSDLSEFFSGKPLQYHNVEHQQLHEKLQEMLDYGGTCGEGATVTINAFYREFEKASKKDLVG